MRHFWVATNGEIAEQYDSEGAAMALRGFYEATRVYHCTPADNRMRDVTEDLAADWWAANGELGAVVPEAYKPFLADEIAELENAEIDPEDDRADHRLHLEREGAWS